MNKSYARDRENGKILGVCAGLARTTGIDPSLVRIAAVLSLILLGPITILAYILTGWLAG